MTTVRRQPKKSPALGRRIITRTDIVRILPPGEKPKPRDAVVAKLGRNVWGVGYADEQGPIQTHYAHLIPETNFIRAKKPGKFSGSNIGLVIRKATLKERRPSARRKGAGLPLREREIKGALMRDTILNGEDVEVFGSHKKRELPKSIAAVEVRMRGKRRKNYLGYITNEGRIFLTHREGGASNWLRIKRPTKPIAEKSVDWEMVNLKTGGGWSEYLAFFKREVLPQE